jgi:hypothetical protein
MCQPAAISFVKRKLGRKSKFPRVGALAQEERLAKSLIDSLRYLRNRDHALLSRLSLPDLFAFSEISSPILASLVHMYHSRLVNSYDGNPKRQSARWFKLNHSWPINDVSAVQAETNGNPKCEL